MLHKRGLFMTATATRLPDSIEEHPPVQRMRARRADLETRLAEAREEITKLRAERASVEQANVAACVARLLQDSKAPVDVNVDDPELVSLDATIATLHTRAQTLEQALKQHDVIEQSVRADGQRQLDAQIRTEAQRVVREMIAAIDKLTPLNDQLSALHNRYGNRDFPFTLSENLRGFVERAKEFLS
jgi:chromosome segregation ATPase